MSRYAIFGMPGCWGSVNRYEKDLIARVDGAISQQEALDLFRETNQARQEYEKDLIARVDGAISQQEALDLFRETNQARQEFEKEFKAVPVSKLTASQKDWIENYCEEIISK